MWECAMHWLYVCLYLSIYMLCLCKSGHICNGDQMTQVKICFVFIVNEIQSHINSNSQTIWRIWLRFAIVIQLKYGFSLGYSIFIHLERCVYTFLNACSPIPMMFSISNRSTDKLMNWSNRNILAQTKFHRNANCKRNQSNIAV